MSREITEGFFPCTWSDLSRNTLGLSMTCYNFYTFHSMCLILNFFSELIFIFSRNRQLITCWNVWNWNCSCEHCWDNEFDKINRGCILYSFKWLHPQKSLETGIFYTKKIISDYKQGTEKKSFFDTHKNVCV